MIVGVGGAIGAVLRWAVGGLMATDSATVGGAAFPWGTFVVNISGCFIIGLFLTVLAARRWSEELRMFIAVGVLGGYTTFSAFAWETLSLARAGRADLAIGYVVGSVALGLAAAALGTAVGRAETRGRATSAGAAHGRIPSRGGSK
jgi:CrcB protein